MNSTRRDRLTLAIFGVLFLAFVLLACKGAGDGAGTSPGSQAPSTPVPNATHVIVDPKPIQSRIIR